MKAWLISTLSSLHRGVREMGAKFLDLLGQSVIVQSFVTMAVVITVCYLVATQCMVPDWFQVLASSIVAYWMGSKTQYTLTRAQQR